MACAQTNVQLYNQLWEAGWEEQDLSRVRHAYDLAVELFSGRFRPMGKPFVSHLVGVASLLERAGAPHRAVVAGVVHSAYPQGDFDTGEHGPTELHRARLRDAVGAEAEDLVERYARLKTDGMQAVIGRLRDGAAIDDADREVLLLDLMDTLEEHHDFGVLYCRKAVSVEKREALLTDSVELANLIERPDLAEQVRVVIGQVYAAERPAVLTTDRQASFTVQGLRQESRVTRALRDPRRALRAARATVRRRG